MTSSRRSRRYRNQPIPSAISAEVSAMNRKALAKASIRTASSTPRAAPRVECGPNYPPIDHVSAEVIHSGSVVDLAAATGYPVRQLYHWSQRADNPTGEWRDMPLSAVVPISKATGRRDIVAALAQAVGSVLVPIPEPTRTAGGVVARLACLAREFGEANVAASAVLDGATRAERARLAKELRELVAEASGLLLSVEGAA